MRAMVTGLLALTALACGDGDPTRLSPNGAYLRATVENVSAAAHESEHFDGTAEFYRTRDGWLQRAVFRVTGTAIVAGQGRRIVFHLVDVDPRPGQAVQLEAMNVDHPVHAGASVQYFGDRGNYLAAEGELLPDVVTEEEVGGTFWFRAFLQECGEVSPDPACLYSPPDDGTWIRVEGQFVAQPPGPIIVY